MKDDLVVVRMRSTFGAARLTFCELPAAEMGKKAIARDAAAEARAKGDAVEASMLRRKKRRREDVCGRVQITR